MSIIIFYFQVDRAVPLFNKYRRCGFKFDVKMYNSIIQGLAEKVTSLNNMDLLVGLLIYSLHTSKHFAD